MTVTLEEAQARFGELVKNAAPGDEIIVTEGEREIARIHITRKREVHLGALAGTVLWMAPDFDEPLDDFRDYMPDDTTPSA